MSQGEITVTVVGNMVTDPELRFTPNGAAVANFRIASTPRRYDSQSNQWVDGEATFVTCNAWRSLAENLTESFSKGMRVIVTGKLKQRNFETREGEKRSVMEIDIEEAGPSLRYATAQVNKNYQGQSTGQAGYSHQQAGQQNLNSSGYQQQQSGGSDQEPPF